MLIILIIYLTGVILTPVMYFLVWRKSKLNFTLDILMISIIASPLSWAVVLTLIGMYIEDVVIFKNKK